MPQLHWDPPHRDPSISAPAHMPTCAHTHTWPPGNTKQGCIILRQCLQDRPSSSGQCILVGSRRVYQEYIVVGFLQNQHSKLSYLRNNQPQLRHEGVQGIVDVLRANDVEVPPGYEGPAPHTAIDADAVGDGGEQGVHAADKDVPGAVVGKPVDTILPASFTGGPRYYRRGYLNSMSLVTEFSNGDLFITMTFNPQ